MRQSATDLRQSANVTTSVKRPVQRQSVTFTLPVSAQTARFFQSDCPYCNQHWQASVTRYLKAELASNALIHGLDDGREDRERVGGRCTPVPGVFIYESLAQEIRSQNGSSPRCTPGDITYCRVSIEAIKRSVEDNGRKGSSLKEARVKKPALTSLASLTVDGDFRVYARSKALSWALNTDVFLLSIDINDLKNRPKNTEELKSQAAERITAMENEPEDATSAVFKDKNGVTLACVFARRPLNVMKIHGESLIRRTWEATQTLHSVVQPITPERDVRHNDEKYMVYIPSGNAPEKSERAGVTHLVHCWTMQGHSKGPFMPSSDFFRGCQAALAVRHYYRATREVAIYLSCMFEVAYPEYYAKYTPAFKAGVWETADPGPWIGRAIIYRYRSTLMGWMMDQRLLSASGTSTEELCTCRTLGFYTTALGSGRQDAESDESEDVNESKIQCFATTKLQVFILYKKYSSKFCPKMNKWLNKWMSKKRREESSSTFGYLGASESGLVSLGDDSAFAIDR
ncbi:hypothetical protein B0H13DRAFT_1922235 [Mycena leptocephala]|nr:hypothetical protein B0H13DRAFT_1922235 [Mycena leptocephala]